MKRRDGVWLIALLALLMGWWTDRDATTSQSAGLQQQIQQLRAAPPLIKFVNTDLRSALMFVEIMQTRSKKRRISIELDWPSLQQAGISRRATVTCTFDDNAIPQSIEKMLGGKAIVTSTPEGYLVRGRVNAD